MPPALGELADEKHGGLALHSAPRSAAEQLHAARGGVWGPSQIFLPWTPSREPLQAAGVTVDVAACCRLRRKNEDVLVDLSHQWGGN